MGVMGKKWNLMQNLLYIQLQIHDLGLRKLAVAIGDHDVVVKVATFGTPNN